ncbi:hypothetical protein [Burkholderia ubonensis]|uniref:hypothetical protein n=1 Tax=Burkholderia ubonensis TaxID=101571 RepID=UPI0007537CB4|nr:hypothetical protein [Burkholderia ubonensis]
MQAIVTKYLGPTDTRGARIKASCDAGSVAIPFDHALGQEERHAAAAMALARKLGWTRDAGHLGRWVVGSLPQHGTPDYAFVFVARLADGYLDTFGGE